MQPLSCEAFWLNSGLWATLIAIPADNQDSAVLHGTYIEHMASQIMEVISYAYHRQCNRGSFCGSNSEHFLAHLGFAS